MKKGAHWRAVLFGFLAAAGGLSQAADAGASRADAVPPTADGKDQRGVAAATSPHQAGAPALDAERQRSDAPAVQFETVYKASVWTGLSGPLRGRGAYLGNLDLKLTLAGEKLYALPGNTVFVHFLHNHGSKPNQRVGAAQGIDNIEVETNTGKVYQFWVQQQFADDRLSLLAGLYDFNSEFYVTDSSALFVHPALGIGTDMSQTGQNGPSIFPTTSLALRLRLEPTETAYLQAAVLDGVPGDPDNPRGTHIDFRAGDGVLWVGEAGLRTGSAQAPGKLALGTWRYSARFDDLVDVDAGGQPIRRLSRGGYLLLEQPLWRGTGDAAGGIIGFARFGLASERSNEFDRALALGAIWQGPIPSRDDDTLGLVFAGARRGEPFRQAAASAGEPVARYETTWELTYRARVADWLWLQPGLQHVTTNAPGAPRSTLGFVRAEMDF